MKVLMTGATGFLGRYVLDNLQKSNIEVHVIGRRPPPMAERTTFTQADLLTTNNFNELIAATDATHLLHLAWYAEHGQYWTSPLNLRWVDATVRLVEAFCQSGGEHVVVAGTCAEYDWSFGFCREDATPLVPCSLYGTAKDAARRLTMAICAQNDISCAWGRVFFPFGIGEANQRLIPALIDVLQKRRPAFGVNASVYRDFLHASDIANGFATLLRAGVTGTYNISSGQPTQIADIVRTLSQLLGKDPNAILSLAPERIDSDLLLIGDSMKLKSLGWRQELSILQGLKRTLSDLHEIDSQAQGTW